MPGRGRPRAADRRRVGAGHSEPAAPWNPTFSAMVYVLSGRGTVGPDERLLQVGQLAVLGPGDFITVRASAREAEGMDVLPLGGLPIREPIAHYGPFVMNSREEILPTTEDFRKGRLGIIPASQITPRNFA
nr:hypothetical protein OG999_29665 [Streptomyces sp. NBC_00886]